jgi:hypothetical protein
VIIHTSHLLDELPTDASDTDNRVTDAVNRATGFVNTWTSKRYYPWDDYQTSPLVTRAPYEIVHACIEVGKAFYYMRIGQIFRDHGENVAWQAVLDYYKDYLGSIEVQPTWEEQSISLNSNNAMVIGDRNAGGAWPQVIPQTAQVISDASNVWLQPDDWYIRKGGEYTDEHYDAWYFYAESSSTEGTLRYQRTYRKDGMDYARYGY